MVSAMLFLTSFFGVRLAATAAEASPPEQPRDSLVIDGLSDADATAVEAAYRHFSGAQVWRLPLPPETTTSLRVAIPAFVTCVDALPRRSLDLAGDCPAGVSLTPLNRTAIIGPGTPAPGPLPPHTVVGDPQLIEHGKVGLLVLRTTGDAQQVERGHRRCPAIARPGRQPARSDRRPGRPDHGSGRRPVARQHARAARFRRAVALRQGRGPRRPRHVRLCPGVRGSGDDAGRRSRSGTDDHGDGCLDRTSAVARSDRGAQHGPGGLPESAFVVYWCDRPPSELTVYHVEESRTDDPNPEDTRYTVSGLKAKNWTTVSAADPAPPWTLESGSTALDARVTYTAQAGKIHQRTDAYSVDFRVTDVQHLSTGQVIYQLAGPAKVAASPAEFVRLISATC